MHFTGSYTVQDEVEIGQFDSSGFSLRARGADATDDVGWIAMDFGGVLGIDLRTLPLSTAFNVTENIDGFGWQPGLLFSLNGVGVGTDAPEDQDMRMTMGATCVNRVTGARETIGTHCGWDAGGTNHNAAGGTNVGEARGNTVQDFSWIYSISVIGFNASEEWLAPSFHGDGYTNFVTGDQPTVIMDHNLLLAIENPNPTLSPELQAAPELFIAPPTFRM